MSHNARASIANLSFCVQSAVQLHLCVPRRACLHFVLCSTISSAPFTCPHHDPSPAPRRAVLMSILSQLFAWTGDGAKQANDVCPPFSLPSLIQAACDSSPHFSQSFSTSTISDQPVDIMPHQTDDATRPAAEPLLPPNPFTRDSPAASRQSPDVTIDLTSPPRSPRDPQQRKAQPGRLVARNKRSADEKRLVGDYQYATSRRAFAMDGGRANPRHSVPADSVRAPDPSSYFESPRPAMGTSKVCVSKLGPHTRIANTVLRLCSLSPVSNSYPTTT
jgi:hypothetical protein